MTGRMLGSVSPPGRPISYNSRAGSFFKLRSTRIGFSAPLPLLLKGPSLIMWCRFWSSSSNLVGFSDAAQVVRRGTEEDVRGQPPANDPGLIQESYWVPLGKEREHSTGEIKGGGDGDQTGSASCGDLKGCGGEDWTVGQPKSAGEVDEQSFGPQAYGLGGLPVSEGSVTLQHYGNSYTGCQECDARNAVVEYDQAGNIKIFYDPSSPMGSPGDWAKNCAVDVFYETDKGGRAVRMDEADHYSEFHEVILLTTPRERQQHARDDCVKDLVVRASRAKAANNCVCSYRTTGQFPALWQNLEWDHNRKSQSADCRFDHKAACDRPEAKESDAACKNFVSSCGGGCSPAGKEDKVPTGNPPNLVKITFGLVKEYRDPLTKCKPGNGPVPNWTFGGFLQSEELFMQQDEAGWITGKLVSRDAPHSEKSIEFPALDKGNVFYGSQIRTHGYAPDPYYSPSSRENGFFFGHAIPADKDGKRVETGKLRCYPIVERAKVVNRCRKDTLKFRRRDGSEQEGWYAEEGIVLIEKPVRWDPTTKTEKNKADYSYWKTDLRWRKDDKLDIFFQMSCNNFEPFHGRLASDESDFSVSEFLDGEGLFDGGGDDRLLDGFWKGDAGDLLRIQWESTDGEKAYEGKGAAVWISSYNCPGQGPQVDADYGRVPTTARLGGILQAQPGLLRGECWDWDADDLFQKERLGGRLPRLVGLRDRRDDENAHSPRNGPLALYPSQHFLLPAAGGTPPGKIVSRTCAT
ncbi:unnamed protein product [Amoebophrya sp. A120]|nr:unnamed protein product [Amoebophrya sp. A120]|eukprot:GSA120T00007070001.1